MVDYGDHILYAFTWLLARLSTLVSIMSYRRIPVDFTCSFFIASLVGCNGVTLKFLIDHKLFEFKRENEKWWRTTKRSQCVVKYISINVEAMAWLVSTVTECAASVGSSEFLKTHGKGNQVLVVQRCHNYYGRFFWLSKFGHKKKRGLIVVLEGGKGGRERVGGSSAKP